MKKSRYPAGSSINSSSQPMAHPIAIVGLSFDESSISILVLSEFGPKSDSGLRTSILQGDTFK